MKTLLFAFILVISNFSLNAQSYLGYATKNVNLRQGPGTNYEIDTVVKQNAQIFLFSLDAENNFYHVIDISTNTEGYVHKDFVKVGKEVVIDENGVFEKTGESENVNPDIEILNDTDLKLTLKIGDEKYFFEPHQKKKIILNPGKYNLIASAPNVNPYVGVDTVSSNSSYSWTFYIKTR